MLPRLKTGVSIGFRLNYRRLKAAVSCAAPGGLQSSIQALALGRG